MIRRDQPTSNLMTADVVSTRENASRQSEKRPTFSVVIPTRNRSDLLEESVRSVLSQTWQDFEIIVVDDHSTDSICDLVLAFQDPRLLCVQNDHQRGGSGARNAGVERARGDWVAFLDDDDLWEQEKLQAQWDTITTTTCAVGVIYTGYVRVNRDTGAVERTYRPGRHGELAQTFLWKNTVGTLSTVVARRDVLNNVGGFDETFAALQDKELFVRLARVCGFEAVPDPLVQYRVSRANRLSTDFEKQYESAVRFRQKYALQIEAERHLVAFHAARVLLYAFLTGRWTACRTNLLPALECVYFHPGEFAFMARAIGRFLRGRCRLAGTLYRRD